MTHMHCMVLCSTHAHTNGFEHYQATFLAKCVLYAFGTERHGVEAECQAINYFKTCIQMLLQVKKLTQEDCRRKYSGHNNKLKD